MNLQNLMNHYSDGDKSSIWNVELYLFGSSLKCNSPRDIDLLLIYDKKVISTDEILYIRNNIREYFNIKVNKPIDIIILSKKEELESNFIQEESCVYIGRI
jgi:hypothetical protein